MQLHNKLLIRETKSASLNIADLLQVWILVILTLVTVTAWVFWPWAVTRYCAYNSETHVFWLPKAPSEAGTEQYRRGGWNIVSIETKQILLLLQGVDWHGNSWQLPNPCAPKMQFSISVHKGVTSSNFKTARHILIGVTRWK